LRNAQLKQTGKYCTLTVNDTKDMRQLYQFLQGMCSEILVKK